MERLNNWKALPRPFNLLKRFIEVYPFLVDKFFALELRTILQKDQILPNIRILSFINFVLTFWAKKSPLTTTIPQNASSFYKRSSVKILRNV